MKARWITLGAVGFTVWLVATVGVAYAVVEWRNDDTQVVVEAPVDVEAPEPTSVPGTISEVDRELLCLEALQLEALDEAAFHARETSGGLGDDELGFGRIYNTPPEIQELIDEYCD